MSNFSILLRQLINVPQYTFFLLNYLETELHVT